ncbi:MAG: hypothetical protein QOF89_39 [Acidobacteriota bacterium]|jgi:hypothetical protein|nr:hypothetical protein [Acidobacteriota bacterium]
MFTRSDGKRLDASHYPGRRSLQVAFLFLCLGLSAAMFSTPVAAAPQSPTSPPASAEERASLRQALESRYEVLPVRDGIALKPRQPRAGIRTIEVTADGVAVNGEKVSARTLRDWLGGDADSVLRLQGLTTADQRQIFGLEGGTSPAPPPIPEVTPAETTAGGETTGETEVSEEPAQAETPEPAGPAEPSGERHSSGSRVNVGGSVAVDKDETVEEAVAIGGSATVEGDVDGDVTAIGGSAHINGRVGGEVVAVGNSVYLGPHAEVSGDVTSVGGRIRREPGAKIHGTTHEVGILPFGRHVHFGRDWDAWPFWGGISNVMSSLMFTVLMALLVCLVLLVARVPLERVDRQLVTQPWKSALVGLAGVVFSLPMLAAVSFLLLITIIGCALFLLYPFLFLFLGLVLLLGYAAVAYRLGRFLEGRFNRSFGSPYMAAIMGVLLIQVWSVLGHMLDLAPGPFGFLVGLFGFLVQAVAWTTGFGAVILARFGFAPGYWPQRGAPVSVPPAPVSPVPYDYNRPIEPLPLSEAEPQPPAEWHEPEP